MRKAIYILALVLVAASIYAIYIFSPTLRGSLNRSYENGGTFSVIYGELYRSNGRRVRLNGNLLLCGNACFSGRTTLSGEFAFTHIPEGNYRLYAVHKECASDEQMVVVGSAAELIVLSSPLVINTC